MKITPDIKTLLAVIRQQYGRYQDIYAASGGTAVPSGDFLCHLPHDLLRKIFPAPVKKR